MGFVNNDKIPVDLAQPGQDVFALGEVEGSDDPLLLHPLIYAKLMDDFPRRLPNVVHTAGFVIRAGQVSQPEIAQVDEQFRQEVSQLQGLRFWRQDSEDGLIVVAPNKLAISHFPPYTSWDEFFPIIQQAFQAYLPTANPGGIERIGLRYINDIQFDAESVDLEDYFEYYPYMGTKLPADYSVLQMSVLMSFNGERDGLRLQLSTLPTENASLIMRLDLDYYLVKPNTVTLDNAMDWLQEAHDQLEEVFEGCLKEAVRAKFDEESA